MPNKKWIKKDSPVKESDKKESKKTRSADDVRKAMYGKKEDK